MFRLCFEFECVIVELELLFFMSVLDWLENAGDVKFFAFQVSKMCELSVMPHGALHKLQFL